MTSYDRYRSYSDLCDRLLSSERLKSSKSLRRFAILHQSNLGSLHDIACTEKDTDLRRFAVEKIIDEDVLFKIAQNDECLPIQKIAISKITNPKKLATLRLFSGPELQSTVRKQIQHYISTDNRMGP